MEKMKSPLLNNSFHTKNVRVMEQQPFPCWFLDILIPPTLQVSLSFFAIKIQKNISRAAHNEYMNLFSSIYCCTSQDRNNEASRNHPSQTTGRHLDVWGTSEDKIKLIYRGLERWLTYHALCLSHQGSSAAHRNQTSKDTVLCQFVYSVYPRIRNSHSMSLLSR